MKKQLIVLALFTSSCVFANTACLDEIESSLSRQQLQGLQQAQQQAQQQVQCFDGQITCKIYEFFEGMKHKRIMAEAVKENKERIAYHEFLYDLESNLLNEDNMREVLGSGIRTNKVVDTFQSRSVCTRNDDGIIKIISKKEMLKLLKQK